MTSTHSPKQHIKFSFFEPPVKQMDETNILLRSLPIEGCASSKKLKAEQQKTRLFHLWSVNMAKTAVNIRESLNKPQQCKQVAPKIKQLHLKDPCLKKHSKTVHTVFQQPQFQTKNNVSFNQNYEFSSLKLNQNNSSHGFIPNESTKQANTFFETCPRLSSTVNRSPSTSNQEAGSKIQKDEKQKPSNIKIHIRIKSQNVFSRDREWIVDSPKLPPKLNNGVNKTNLKTNTHNNGLNSEDYLQVSRGDVKIKNISVNCSSKSVIKGVADVQRTCEVKSPRSKYAKDTNELSMKEFPVLTSLQRLTPRDSNTETKSSESKPSDKNTSLEMSPSILVQQAKETMNDKDSNSTQVQTSFKRRPITGKNNLTPIFVKKTPVESQQGSPMSVTIATHTLIQNLKQRHTRHEEIAKKLSTMNRKITLDVLTDQENSVKVELLLIRKLFESSKTTIFVFVQLKTRLVACLKREKLRQLKENPHFLDQFKIHSSVCHRQIVRSYCLLYDTKYLYIMMEYMQGHTLTHQLHHNLMTNLRLGNSLRISTKNTRWAKKVLYELVEAVSYLHDRGIMHRDIKPDNIFISHLGDYGCATCYNDRKFMGTLDYAAPEIIRSQSYDLSADMWSVGCIAYELNVNRPPFFNVDREETIRLITNVQYNAGLVYDPDLRRIIQGLLQKNGSARLTAKQLLADQYFEDMFSEQ